MTLLFLIVAAALTVGLGQAALAKRRDFELRMQILEVLELAARRGLPIADPLLALARSQTRAQRLAVERLARDLEQGEDLAEALQWAVADSFPGPIRSVIDAAQATAELPEVLRSLRQQTEDRIGLQHRAALVLLYPAMLLVGVLAINRLWMPVRQASPFLSGAGKAPWGVGFSTDLPVLWLAISLFCTLLCGHTMWRRAPLLRRLGRELWSKLPWRSPAGHLLACEQFLFTLAFLVRAGVTLPAALLRSSPVADSPRLRDGVGAAEAALQAGASLEDALRISRLPDYAVAGIVAAGQASPLGLADAIQRAAHEARLRYLTSRERLIGLMNPVLLLVVGLVMGLYVTGAVTLSGQVVEGVVMSW